MDGNEPDGSRMPPINQSQSNSSLQGQLVSRSRPNSNERLPKVRSPGGHASDDEDTKRSLEYDSDNLSGRIQQQQQLLQAGQQQSLITSDDDFDVDTQPNPFSLPKEDVFMLRERERQLKLQEREKLKKMRIWEKPAKLSEVTEGTKRHVFSHTSPITDDKLSNANKDRIFQPRRREKENMADFIAKKRDMFLIQMSLDTKRQEIQKLEEKAAMKEDALRKSEMMLEEDAMRFDAFLKENDRKAHDALKRADQETKEKQEKVMEIKKLNQEISKVENEMSKYEEQLHACLKYKEFLDSLTLPEYLEQIKAKKEERKRKKREQRELQQKEKEGSRSGSASARQGAITSSSNKDDNNKQDDANQDDDDDTDDDGEPMHFQRPEQLLDIFAQLEERNLFLIQNVQETEEALEELKQKFEETQKQMEEKTNLLHGNISDLKGKIAAENEKREALKKRTRANHIAGNQQNLLQGLSDKVREVYIRCGFDGDTQTDTLDMLREIEGWLEYLLNEIKQMDPEKVEVAEKKKNADRRDRIRKIKKEEQKKQYEERLAKSTARAKAEVVKRTGKQVMFRSPPIRKKKVKEQTVQRDEEAEELKKFFT